MLLNSTMAGLGNVRKFCPERGLSHVQRRIYGVSSVCIMDLRSDFLWCHFWKQMLHYIFNEIKFFMSIHFWRHKHSYMYDGWRLALNKASDIGGINVRQDLFMLSHILIFTCTLWAHRGVKTHLTKITVESKLWHDDVMTWKRFSHDWLFGRAIYRSRGLPSQRAGNVGIWCFLSSRRTNSSVVGDLKRHAADVKSL